MTSEEIRELQFKKSRDFSAEFIGKFSREWNQAVRRVKSSGARLDAILIAEM